MIRRAPMPSRAEPMRRASAPRRGAPIVRTAQLRPRSAKMAALYRQRVPMLQREWGDGQPCAVPDCGRAGTDPHEPLTRARGGKITDPLNLAWVCSRHHREAHEERPAMYEAALIRHSWDTP